MIDKKRVKLHKKALVSIEKNYAKGVFNSDGTTVATYDFKKRTMIKPIIFTVISLLITAAISFGVYFFVNKMTNNKSEDEETATIHITENEKSSKQSIYVDNDNLLNVDFDFYNYTYDSIQDYLGIKLSSQQDFPYWGDTDVKSADGKYNDIELCFMFRNNSLVRIVYDTKGKLDSSFIDKVKKEYEYFDDSDELYTFANDNDRFLFFVFADEYADTNEELYHQVYNVVNEESNVTESVTVTNAVATTAPTTVLTTTTNKEEKNVAENIDLTGSYEQYESMIMYNDKALNTGRGGGIYVNKTDKNIDALLCFNDSDNSEYILTATGTFKGDKADAVFYIYHCDYAEKDYELLEGFNGYIEYNNYNDWDGEEFWGLAFNPAGDSHSSESNLWGSIVCKKKSDSISERPLTGKVNIDSGVLNIRDTDNAKGKVQGTLEDDEKVNIVTTVGDWYLIYNNGIFGFVSAEFIELDK